MHMPLVLTNRRRRGGSGFSPTALFALAEPGVWFDPSDLTTLFQDPAGTTPVTTPGQTVGLMLDKSKGLALGAELIVDPTFSNPAAWLTSANTSVSSGVGRFVSPTVNGDNIAPASDMPLVAGRYYRVTFTIKNYVSGSVRLETLGGGSVSIGEIIGNANGTYTEYLLAQPLNTKIRIRTTTTNASLEVDDFLVRELAGNHATQATLAARPTYSIEPVGGRRNLLTWSEDFSNAFWGKTGATIPVTQYLAPDGTTTADKIDEQATSGVHLVFNASGLTVATGQYTDSIYLKAAERGFGFAQIATDGATKRYTVVVDLSTGAVTATSSVGTPTGTANSVVDAGNGWWRVSVRANHASGLAYLLAGPVPTGVPTFEANATPTYTGTAGSGIYLWGAQLELGSTATNYQRVTTQYDVTEAGVQSLGYLFFDGGSDFMSTPTITPGTDKVQVFTGVRKLSDAAQGVVVGAEVALNGIFELNAPGGGTVGESYSFRSRGTTAVFASTGGTFLAPTTNVISALGDISGDTAILRANGTQVGTSTADQGTGNYTAQPYYLGRRSGSSLPFSGHIHSLITRFGPTLDAPTIAATEAWVASKTPGVTL